MTRISDRKKGRGISILAGACLAGGVAIAYPQISKANIVVNVGLANFSTTATTGNATNGGINPITYTPTAVTIPVAPGQTYVAADTTDSGTIWNSLQSVSTAPTSVVSSVLYEQNLPLLNSTGGSTTALLNVTALEGAGKTDAIHTNKSTNNGGTNGTGTDGLNTNPSSSTYGASLVGDGYNNNPGDQELMGTNWIANGATDGMSFQVTGLPAGATFNLYVYGSGTANGQGGTFTLAGSNGGGAATTNSNPAGRFLSVFDSTGINPAPEKGLSWNLLTGTVDNSGDVTFNVTSSETTSPIKAAMNGFQLDVSVPEPTSFGLLALGSLGLLARKRSKI